MSDHHLQREEDPGDRRVEGGRHRRRDTAAQECAAHRAAQMQALCDPGPNGSAEMNDRPFAADGAADADRSRVDQRDFRPLLQRHPAAAQRGHLDHLGDRLRPSVGKEVVGGKTDHQPAQRRRQQDAPPGDIGDEEQNVLAPVRQKSPLDQVHSMAEQHGGGARGETDGDRIEEKPQVRVGQGRTIARQEQIAATASAPQLMAEIQDRVAGHFSAAGG